MVVVAGMGACRPGGGGAGPSLQVDGEAGAKASTEREAGAKPSEGESADAAPRVASDWCIEGMTALDEDVCYVLPAGATRLLVYLHGIVPPTKAPLNTPPIESGTVGPYTTP